MGVMKRLHQFAGEYLGQFPGSVAMKPKLVLNPQHFRMAQRQGYVPSLDDVLQFVEGKSLYVHELRGKDCATIAHARRDALDMKTYDYQRVHITRSPAEIDIVDFAKTHDSRETAEHIRANYTIDDLS